MARGMRPAVEGLEPRELLSNMFAPGTTRGVRHPAYARYVNRSQGIAVSDRRIAYNTADGAHVTITLVGYGSLQGTTHPGGVLNLVYGGTSPLTTIIGRVTGGTGHAPLASILPANVPAQTFTGIGLSPIYELQLGAFDLKPGGAINLTAGVHALLLNSVGPGAQVHLRELPETLRPALHDQTQLISGAQTVTVNGQALTYAYSANGATTLTGIKGQFTTGPNLKANTIAPDGLKVVGAPPAPPGAIIDVHQINGTAAPVTLPNAQVFGYDPTAQALIRFDALTGAILNSYPVNDLGPGPASVALATNGTEPVVLVGIGTLVDAFDASTGAPVQPVHQFSTANLAAVGVHTISGLGTAGGVTFVADAQANLLQGIDVTKSLATAPYQAVTVGTTYFPLKGFKLDGGLTGVPGSNLLFATGTATFDAFQPGAITTGVLVLSMPTAGGPLVENTRVPFKSDGRFQSPAPGVLGGTVDQFLALLSGANDLTLYNTANLGTVAQVQLVNPNRLSDLTESYWPGYSSANVPKDAALFDVQGNIQSFRTHVATGMVLNDLGNLNLLKADRLTNSAIIAFPFTHAEIGFRSNVTILTPLRSVGDRNGVLVVPNLAAVEPLKLP